MLDLLKILKDKGSLNTEEYELLVNASRADAEKVEAASNELSAELDKKTSALPTIRSVNNMYLLALTR